MGDRGLIAAAVRLARRCLLPAGLAGAAVALLPTSGLAFDFCWDDPALTINGSNGHAATVYVTTYASSEHKAQVEAQTISYSISTRGSTVTVNVFVPTGDAPAAFTTAATVSTGVQSSGQILAGAWGQSGQAMALSFRLPSGQPAGRKSR